MSSIEEISFKEIFLNDENNEFYIEILNITKKLINHNEAEDIIHDVIINGIAKDVKITIRNNKLQDSVIKYLTTSILNKNKDYFRKEKFKKLLDQDFDEFYDNYSSNKKTGLYYYSKEEITNKLAKEINDLDDNLKKVMQFKYLGYKESEIADKLKIPVGTVKSRISKAKEILENKILVKQAFDSLSLFDTNDALFVRSVTGRPHSQSFKIRTKIISIKEIFELIK